MCQMLTLYSRHFDSKNNEWETIVVHIFSKFKNPKADYHLGIQILKTEFAKRSVPVRPLVKFSDNCPSENKSRFVLADSKLDEVSVSIFKTPGISDLIKRSDSF